MTRHIIESAVYFCHRNGADAQEVVDTVKKIYAELAQAAEHGKVVYAKERQDRIEGIDKKITQFLESRPDLNNS